MSCGLCFILFAGLAFVLAAAAEAAQPRRPNIIFLGRNGATRYLDARAHPTLPARLQAAGYVTAAVGKWHLGPMPGQDVVPASAATDTD